MSSSTALAGVVAVLVAAAAGVLAFGLWFCVPDILALGLFWILIATPVALGHCIFLAAPLYAAMIGRWSLGWCNAGLAGFAVGAVPIPLWIAVSVHDVHDTLMAMLWFGGSGLAGGLVFRAVRGPRLAGRSPA